MMQDVLLPGDRVRLIVDLGPMLPAGSIGYIVREYEPLPLFTTQAGAVEYPCPRYAAVFPILRERWPTTESWTPKEIEVEGLSGDMIPICEREVEVLDNMTEGGDE